MQSRIKVGEEAIALPPTPTVAVPGCFLRELRPRKIGNPRQLSYRLLKPDQNFELSFLVGSAVTSAYAPREMSAQSVGSSPDYGFDPHLCFEVSFFFFLINSWRK